LIAASVLAASALAPTSRVSAIYGGEQAFDEGAVVPVTIFPNGSTIGWCSGVLWKPRIVLTAAHCVVAPGSSAAYSTAQVRVGRPGTVRGDGDVFYPSAIITPPDFINRTYVTDQDLAALVFDRDIAATNVTRLATASEAEAWAAAGSALDLVGYEIRDGASWDAGTVVTTRHSGATLFVAVADAAERVFYIKAIDEVGLLSPTASSVTAAVSPPDGVTAFDVVPQGDHVRASWEPVDGSGVEYEMRAGLTWGTGRFVGRAAGNHLAALWPIRDATDETFWIKAVSPAGLYSDMAAYATTRLAPLTGRNAILTSDRQALNWAGVTQGMEVIGGNLLALARTGGANLPRGEYVFPVDLGRTWRARNWLEARIATVPADDLTWDVAAFRWDDAEAASAWLPLGDVDGATVRTQIAVEASLANDLIEGFRLAGNVTGVKGMAATQAANLGYAPARFDQGLKVGGGTKAAWPVNIPSEFSTTFDIRLDTLLDEPIVYLALTGTAGTLRLIWSPDIGAFALEDDRGRRVVASLVRRAGDLVTFGICQTPITRRLFAASIQTGAIASGAEPFAPLGAFTGAQLHPA